MDYNKLLNQAKAYDAKKNTPVESKLNETDYAKLLNQAKEYDTGKTTKPSTESYVSSLKAPASASAAASADDKVTESEFNRSPAMQQKYGSYSNYLKGIVVKEDQAYQEVKTSSDSSESDAEKYGIKNPWAAAAANQYLWNAKRYQDDVIDPEEAAAIGAAQIPISIATGIGKAIERAKRKDTTMSVPELQKQRGVYSDSQDGSANEVYNWWSNLSNKAQEQQNVAYSAGSMAANLALMSGIASGVYSIPGFENLPNLAQNAISSGVSLGALSAASNAGAVSAGNMSGKEYFGNVAFGTLSGAVGGAASSGVGAVGAPILKKLGLQNNTLANAAMAGLSGAGFALGSAAVTETGEKISQKDQYKFDAAQIGRDALVGFAFAAIGYYSRNYGKSTADGGAANDRYTQQENELADKYFKNMTPEEANAAYKNYVKKYHPDRYATADAETQAKMTSMMQEINIAYERFCVNFGAKAYNSAKSASTGSDEYAKSTSEFTKSIVLLQEVQPVGQVSPEVIEATQILNSVAKDMTSSTVVNTAEASAASGLPQYVPKQNYQDGTREEANQMMQKYLSEIASNRAKNETVSTEETAVNDNPDIHTPEEQRIIEEYKNSVDPNLVDFYNESKSVSTTEKSSKLPGFSLSPANDRMINDIEKYTGIDTTGWKTILDVKQANHIYREHGEHGKANQTMKNDEDVGRMQYVLDNYDRAVDFGTTDAYWEPKENGKNRQAKTIAFMKKINGTYFIIEAVPNTSAKTINVLTAFIADKNKLPYGKLGKKVAEALTQPTDATNAPQRYGQTATVHNTSAVTSIANESEKSQEKSSKISPKYTDGKYIKTSDGTIGKITRAYDGGNGSVWYDAVAENGSEFSVPEKNVKEYQAQEVINGYINTLKTTAEKTRAKNSLTESRYNYVKSLADNPDVYVEVTTEKRNFGSGEKEVQVYRAYGVEPSDDRAFQQLTKIEYGLYNFLKEENLSDVNPAEIKKNIESNKKPEFTSETRKQIESPKKTDDSVKSRSETPEKKNNLNKMKSLQESADNIVNASLKEMPYSDKIEKLAKAAADYKDDPEIFAIIKDAIFKVYDQGKRDSYIPKAIQNEKDAAPYTGEIAKNTKLNAKAVSELKKSKRTAIYQMQSDGGESYPAAINGYFAVALNPEEAAQYEKSGMNVNNANILRSVGDINNAIRITDAPILRKIKGDDCFIFRFGNGKIAVENANYVKAIDNGGAFYAVPLKGDKAYSIISTDSGGNVYGFCLGILRTDDADVLSGYQTELDIAKEYDESRKIRKSDAKERAAEKIKEENKNLWSNPQKESVSPKEVYYDRAGKVKKDSTGQMEIRIESNPERKDVVGETSDADRWTANRISGGNADAKPKSITEIVSWIQHEFGFNITSGNIRGNKTRGQFNPQDKGIRSKIENNLPTISHELGHALDDRYNILKRLSAGVKQELTDHLSDETKARYPKENWAQEGIAEFLRKYLQNRETAAIDYPQFTDLFLRSISPYDRTLIEQLSDDVNAYYSLGANSAGNIRLREEGRPDYRTAKEKIKDYGDEFYQAWVDSNHGLKLAEESMGGSGKAYILATNSAYSGNIAANIITGHLTDANAKYVGLGLKEALRGVNTNDRKEYLDFNEYLVCLHGPERLERGKRVFADDRKNSTQWMNQRASELESQHPQFRDAALRLIEFERQFTETWGVGYGLIDRATFDKWNETYKFHVPFNRAMEKGKGGGAKKGYANQTSPYKRAKGSGRDIIAPVDNIIDEIVRVVNTAVRNNVMLELRKCAISDHADANYMERIPDKLVPKNFNTEAIKDRLSKAVSESGLSGETISTVDNIIQGLENTVLQFEQGRPSVDIITILVNGKPEFWKVNDPLLLQSVANMAPAKLSGFMEVYGNITRFMTQHITGGDAIWSIFSNAPRDTGTLISYTKEKKQLFNVFKSMGSAYLNSWNNMRDKAVDPLFAEYLALGGGKASMYSADRDLAKKARSSIAKDKNPYRFLNPINDLRYFGDAVGFVSDTIEMGPRFATYKVLRESGMDAQEAFYEAMDITTNFRKAGAKSRELNKLFPFFNASVQGIDKFGRFFTGSDQKTKGTEQRKKVVKSRIATYLTASAILGALMIALNQIGDEDRKNYKQLSNYTKNSYFTIPLGDGKYFAIPKPRELAVLISAIQAGWEMFAGGNENAFEEFYSYALDQFLPSVVSDLLSLPENIAQDGLSEGLRNTAMDALGDFGIIGVFVNVLANRDFLGRPIESAYDQYHEAKDRYNDSTSKMAYWIGQAFNLSPKRIDYIGKQVLGYLWKYPSVLLPTNAQQRDLSLGVKNRYIKDSVYSTDVVNWLYDRADKTSRASKSDSENISKKIDSLMDSRMTSFYSNFNKLNRENESAENKRETRQIVLDLISEYRDSVESEGTPSALKKIYDVVEATKDTGVLPAVMTTTVSNLNGTEYKLTDKQYYEYQTYYLDQYYSYAESSLPFAKNNTEKIAVLNSARIVAKEKAEDYILKKSGYLGNGYFDKYDGISDRDIVTFNAKVDVANDDGSLKQEELIDIINSMVNNGLSFDEASTLFHTKYDSDRNNPWAK